jgi:transcriptional regulator with XRE-family HTH domain
MEQTGTLKVKEVERVYEVNGDRLLKALNDCGMSQAQLARECGYLSSARVCHIVKGGVTRIGGKPLKKIVNALARKGVVIEGFYG